MANGKPTSTLIVQPRPQITRYNRLALWGGISMVVLIVVTYSLVIRDHGHRVVEPRKSPVTTLQQPLMEFPPTPPPPPAPEPPPKKQPVTWHPVEQAPPPPPPAPRDHRHEENPLVTKRRKEREDSYRAPLLVAAFSFDKGQQ